MTHAQTNDTKPKIRTPEEIETLKKEWLKDPCWDIENTEGFEAHHPELLGFRDGMKMIEAKELRRQVEIETKRIQGMADGFGCSYQIAEILDRLDRDVRTLRKMIGEDNDPDTVVYRLQRMEGRI